MEPRPHSLESRLAAIVAPTLADMGYELVRVMLIGRDRPTVQIMADRADGALISVADCETITHAVGAVLDVEDPMPGAWTLEVARPASTARLTRVKDWNRFAGHLARAETEMPIDGRKRFSGIGAGRGRHRRPHAARRRHRGRPAARPCPPRQAGADRRADRRHRHNPQSPTECGPPERKPWTPLSLARNCCWSPTPSRGRRTSTARKCWRRWNRPSRRPAAPSTATRRTSAPPSTARPAMCACRAGWKRSRRSRTRKPRSRSTSRARKSRKSSSASTWSIRCRRSISAASPRRPPSR